MNHANDSLSVIAPGPVLAVLLLALPACSVEPRVAIIDVQQAFQRSPLAMVAALRVKEVMGGAQREIKRRGRSLAELRKRVEHGGLELDAVQRREVGARIQRETALLAERQSEYRADLAATQQRLGEEMIEHVESVAREVAAREGLALLFRKRDALYAADGVELPNLEITEQVIRALLDKINPEQIPEQPAVADTEPRESS